MTSGLSLDHLALPIFDVPASRRFYGDVLGLPLIDALSGDDWAGKPWLMMIYGLIDGRQLVLVALRGAERTRDTLPRDVRHFAFSCPSEEARAAWKQKLNAASIAFWEEDHGAQRSLYFEDPSGIVLEITSPASATAIARRADAEETVRAWCAS